jgi:uncharacterized protein YbaR (Trm112 family)
MDSRLIEIIVCPICKGPLRLDKLTRSEPAQPEAELVCTRDRLAFPIRDGIPVMLVDDARRIIGD